MFINFLHMGAIFCCLSSIHLESSTLPIRTVPVSGEQKKTFPIGYFSHPSPKRTTSKFFELSFPQEVSKWMTVRISFKRNHWVFDVWPRLWPLVSWKTYPYIWTLRLWNFKHPWCVLHFYLGVSWYCVGGLSQRILVLSQWRPSLLQQSICEADDPLSVKTTYAPEPSLTMSNSALLEMTNVFQCGKVDFLFVSSRLQNNLFFCS